MMNMTAPVRESFNIPYHDIGPVESNPAIALVSGLHGDEINGVYILSRLVHFLKEVEKGSYPKFKLVKRAVIIPAVNVLGINTLRRAWPFDNTDINRMFPGNIMGETTQRIAYSVLETTKRADFRIDLHSSNLFFEEIPQIRIYDPGPETVKISRMFGLSTIMVRKSSPVFTTTLMSSWSYWPGHNFLLQIGRAGSIQLDYCQRVFQSIMDFMGKIGVISGLQISESDEETFVFQPSHSVNVYAEKAGMFVSDKTVGKWVLGGEELGYIYDSFNGDVISNVTAPVSGLLTGIRRHPMLFEGDHLLRICRKPE